MGSRPLGAAAIVALSLVAGVMAADTDDLLVQVVKEGNREGMRALLAKRVDVNAPEPDGTTALHWAVKANDLESVALLLRAGADARAANRYGVRPLSLAAMNGHAAIAEALLRAGADPNTSNREGETALMTAARTGNVATLKVLLGGGADANAREGWLGETGLMWAAAENHAEATKVLIEAGADVNLRSTVTDTPKLEFPRSGGPNTPFPVGGWTALMYAARQGAVDAVRVLADAGADLNATDPEGTTALVFAIINAHYDLAAVLLEKGADPNIADETGMEALYAAVDMNTLQWVQGRPAPLVTDQLDAAGLVAALLRHGANPDAQLKRPPLKRHHDAADGSLGEGTTPLMRAAKLADVKTVKLLLDAGADPFLGQKDYTTALLFAAGLTWNGVRAEGPRIPLPTEEGAIEVLTMLLDRGADVNGFNSAGMTALHGAVGRGEHVVRFLAARGARLNVRNKAGRTPLDLALGVGGRGGRAAGRPQVAAALKELMAATPVAAAKTSAR